MSSQLQVPSVCVSVKMNSELPCVAINSVIDVRQNIPKLAINDEAPWTPKLTPDV